MTDVKPRVVAVIPCYNTAPHIAEVVAKTLPYVDEVFVVDDGSTDDTAEIAKAAGAKVVSHGKNLGYGEAIKTCFRLVQSNGHDILVTIDGDGQHNPEDIPLLIEDIVSGEADFVIGSRFLENNHNMPGYRKLGIGTITWLWNVFSKVRVSDSQCGFRAYSKVFFKDLVLSENGMCISIEILEKARRKGVNITEKPVSCLYTHSSIHLGAVSHGSCVAFSVIRIRLKRDKN
ncbi:glycosyltransferase family 2 protein [Chloroflexota bacterium]